MLQNNTESLAEQVLHVVGCYAEKLSLHSWYVGSEGFDYEDYEDEQAHKFTKWIYDVIKDCFTYNLS